MKFPEMGKVYFLDDFDAPIFSEQNLYCNKFFSQKESCS